MDHSVIEQHYDHFIRPVVRRVDRVYAFCWLLFIGFSVAFLFIFNHMLQNGFQMDHPLFVGIAFWALVLIFSPLFYLSGYAKRILIPYVCDFFSHASLSYALSLNIAAKHDPEIASCFESMYPHVFSLYGNPKKKKKILLACDDFFYGNYRDIPFVFSDYNLFQAEGEESEHIHTGLVIALFQKTFARHRVFLCRDGRKPPAFMQKICLEDPLFEDYFDAYADDQIAARRVLTPLMMEKILNLSAVLNEEWDDSIVNLSKDITPEIVIDPEMVLFFIPKINNMFEFTEGFFSFQVKDEAVLQILKDINSILQSISYMADINLVQTKE